MKMIFLVDGDNNIGTGLQGADQLTADDSILVFYQKTGLALSKIKELCKGSRASIQFLESVKGGKNSIDFQIITELGVLVGRGEADCAYVISQDKGYEAAMSALRVRYADAFREVALRPSIAACLKASYLLRATDLPQLETALAQEFGSVQGVGVFRHLRGLFSQDASAAETVPAAVESVPAVAEPVSPAVEPVPAAAEPVSPAETTQKPAVKKSRSRRRSPSQKVKTAEQPAQEKLAATGSAKPGVKMAEKPGERAVVTGAAKPVVKAVEKPAEKAAEKPPVKTTRPHRSRRKKPETDPAE